MERNALSKLHTHLRCPDNGGAQTDDDGGGIDAVFVEVEVLRDVEEVGEGGEDHAEPRSHRHHQAWGQPAGQPKHPVNNTVPGLKKIQTPGLVFDRNGQNSI